MSYDEDLAAHTFIGYVKKHSTDIWENLDTAVPPQGDKKDQAMIWTIIVRPK